MKRTTILTTLLLLAVLAARAQELTSVKAWYINGYAFIATYSNGGNTIAFNGGSLHEGGIQFTMRKANDDAYYYRVSDDGVAILGGSKAYEDNISGVPVLVIEDDKDNAAGVMRATDTFAELEDLIDGELGCIVEGEYKDAQGRNAHITQGFLQLPGEKGHDMIFGCEDETPVNIMEAGGKSWRFIATYDGLTLYPIRLMDESDVYEDVPGGRTIHLVRQNGTAGRWPSTSDLPVQRSWLQYLDKKALRYMRNEIFARHGYRFSSADLKKYFAAQPWYDPLPEDAGNNVHFSKAEQINIDIIKAEEASRK